jgi:ectoine hydroxylase-related dioxygenase (phytanoyl-CoA dioxygenase family)
VDGLTDVHPGNGGLFGCPGSHRMGAADHVATDDYQWHDALSQDRGGLAPPVAFELVPGDAVIWDRYFAHGSAGNTSVHDRRGVVFVFAPAASAERAKDWVSLSDIRATAAEATDVNIDSKGTA